MTPSAVCLKLSAQDFYFGHADEIDLVNSGLEESMAVAYNQIREVWKSDPKIPGLRTAAFINSINKVATCYAELGIFP